MQPAVGNQDSLLQQKLTLTLAHDNYRSILGRAIAQGSIVSASSDKQTDGRGAPLALPCTVYTLSDLSVVSIMDMRLA